MRHYRRRVDANQREIVAALRAGGASVVDLSAVGGGVPDLAIGYRGVTMLVEVKNPKNRKVRGDSMTRTMQRQAEFRERWKGAKPRVIESCSQATQLLAEIEFYTRTVRIWPSAPEEQHVSAS